MRALIHLLWSISRLRCGPQVLPNSLPLFIFLLVVNIAMGWFQFSYRYDFATSLAYTLLMQLILMGFTHLLLTLRGYTDRFLQTVSALIGANIIINLFIYPFMLLAPILLQPGQSLFILTLFRTVLVLSRLALVVWFVLITSHIYRYALNISFIAGLLVTFTLMGSEIIIFRFIARM